MTFEDFGLTDAQVAAAINGSEADRRAIFDQIASSDRIDDLLAYLRKTQPQAHRVIAPYLREHRDQRGGMARPH